MTIHDEVPSPDKTYSDYLAELLNSLTVLKNQSLENREESYKQLATVESALETMLNWIILEKNAIKNFETVLEWVELLSKDKTLDTDEARYRIRVVIQPQIESFIQNLALGEKSALSVLDIINKNLENFADFLKGVQANNFKILSIIGFEPESQTSHLDLALTNLYQGRFKDFQKELSILNDHLNPSESSEENETNESNSEL
ncbi:MAG: hypothetical protein ACW97X_01375 [Candidatus Hodarchaeales archaeon]|jgi:hypothetical protein